MPKTAPYVHLHLHTEFSILDGLGTVDEYVEKAKELRQPALAITDHGVLAGLPEFYHKCREEDIEPILGCEFYFVPDAAYRPEKGESHSRFHTTILGRGERGYQLLCELSNESHRNFYHKPLLDRAMLESLGDEAEHLVVLSGCAGSAVSSAIREKDMEGAARELMWWRELFPHYYMELMHHDTAFDKQLNAGLVKLAKKYKVPWVITNDPHYVHDHDETYHDTLLAIQTASDVEDPNRFRFDGTGYHLRSHREIAKAFQQYGKAIWAPGMKRTLEVAKLCRTRIPVWEKRTWHIPRFPDTEDAYGDLKKLTVKGLKEKGLAKEPKYVKQVKHELKVIKQMDLADFMLITRDSIEWAREQGIPVGPGRGSVCGTLVGYLVGIHKIDPIRYDLLFERFLNPARPRMPDIDTDFGQARRKELFTYVEDKYGIENVVHVATYQRMKLKKAIHSLGKAYGMSFNDRMELSKKMSDEDDDPIEDTLPVEIIEAFPEMAATLERLSGIKSAYSTHPAGVIIADPQDRIRELVPEMWLASTKKMVGQYDLEAAEAMGLMKQDFLGLRALDTVDECVKLIEANTGELLDPDSWIPDEEEHDRDIYKMLAKGHTGGVFQMEGVVNQRGCREVKPKSFEDLVSITSLYRTGPIKAGYPKKFNENRLRGRDNIAYYTPELEPILRETWGVILYQEQVMRIAEELAGFDMEMVDDIKEAIKHKKSKLMVSLQPLFVEGCGENGISEEAAKKIWKDIEGYSGYSYNRSHAVAYTFQTYQTARLKHLYPLEFHTALIRTVKGSSPAAKQKREWYLKELVEYGYKILPPDINISDQGATPDYEADAMRFGLLDVKGIGDSMCKRLLEYRAEEGSFTTYDQVAEALNNKGALQVLADASVLESIGISGDEAETERLLGWMFTDKMEKYRKKYKRMLRLPKHDGQECVVIGEITSSTKGRTKNGKQYCTWKIRHSITDSFDIRLWQETSRLWDLGAGSIVIVSGKWEAKWMNIGIGDPNRVRVVKRT